MGPSARALRGAGRGRPQGHGGAIALRGRPAGARIAALLATAVLLAACADAAPSPTPAATAAPVATAETGGSGATPPPAERLPLPDADTSSEQVLLRDADGTYDRYGSVGQLRGAASTCTAVLLDTGADTGAPAYAVTNGHCVGINGANELLLDADAGGASVAFDWFVDVPAHVVVPVARIAWATMKDTDLAVLELDASVGELRGKGLRGWWPADAFALEGGSADVVMLGVPVGQPLVDIPEEERFLRLGTCSLDTGPARVNERQWLWTRSLRTDCPQVLPGNSGSAVLDASTGRLLGVINTTTYKGEGGAECWLGRPCEVSADGEVSLPDTSYAQPVAGLDACFASGRFATGGSCPLAAAAGPTLEGAPLAVNPSAPRPLEGMPPSQATWDTTVASDTATAYRWKAGPLGTTDCSADAGYSAPVPVTRSITEPLPRTEQRLLLCVAADEPGGMDRASIAVAFIDTTPPSVPVRFSAVGDGRDGWRIEPVFDPPELSSFIVKGGPAAATNCADRDGYAPYRRIPIAVEAAEAPYRFCAIGFDDAGNAAPPASRILR